MPTLRTCSVHPVRWRSAARSAARCVLLVGALHAAEAFAQQPSSAARAPIDLLTFHRPNYFITGFSEETQVKFQFSIKYDLWPTRGGHDLYFAYTQKSLWDLWSFSRSSPFRESNYNPELFYSYSHRVPNRTRPGCGLGPQRAGVEHESNGEAGALSRSWNRFYAASGATCVDARGRAVDWGLKLWLPFAKPDNSDITDYLGYGEVVVRAGMAETSRWWGSSAIALHGRKGVSDNGSVLAELTWRPGYGDDFTRFFRFAPYLFAQLFVGQGETLLTYNRTTHSARVGFALRD